MTNESPDKHISPLNLPYAPKYQFVEPPLESPTQSVASSSASSNKQSLSNANGSPVAGLMSSVSVGKSRRTRPKSIYSDLDGYINNSTPSLLIDSKGSPKKLNDDYMDLQPPPSPSFRFGPPGSPTRKNISSRRSSPTRRRDSQSSNYNGNGSPFNYASISISNNTTNILQKASHRKGHRYKHSSVSMNFFQEPKKKSSQLSIPTSLPIPDFRDFIDSLKDDQKFKLCSCAIHLVYASIVFVFGFRYSLPCLTTLSHLVFFDSINNLLTIIVQVFKNFEVWDKTSIKRPFGLSRLEVLFGFALSVALFYVGFDLITHCIEEFVISLIDLDFNHENHHEHNENSREMSPFLFTSLVLSGLFITLVNSKLLSHTSGQSFDAESTDIIKKNSPNFGLLNDEEEHDYGEKSSKLKQVSFIKSAFMKLVTGIRIIITKNNIVTNPIKLLTVIFIMYLLIFYQYFTSIILSFNEIQTFVIAILILYFAFLMMKKIFVVILLAFPYNSKVYNRISTDIENKIFQSEGFKSHYRLDRILITKINYSSFIILVKLNMKGGSDQDEYNVRTTLKKIIKSSIIKAEQENGNINFEITIDVDRM